MKEISSPADERTVRDLRIGDVVHITGMMVTGRDRVHIRSLSSERMPKELNGATLFHCGPIIVREGREWKVIAAGPTTSARMNALGAEMIRRSGLRMIIGKGGMSDDVLEAMKETGCVYLAAIGGAAVSLAECIIDVVGVEWEDLGMAEAMWKFRTERFGPLVVAMDAGGNSIYKDTDSRVRTNLRSYF